MQLEVIARAAEAPTSNPPMLFVHGAWHGAWCWEPHFLPYFAKHGYASYALSLRAHGKSAGRAQLRGKRIAQYADDVAQIAAQCDQSPILIGHSMGTLVVQKYLERHPAKAAVLLAPVPPNGVIALTLQVARRHPGLFARMNATLSLYPLVATPALAREAFFSSDLPEGKVRAYQQQMQDEAYLAYLDMLILNLPHPKRVRRRHPLPMLILGGADDRIFSPRQVQQTAKEYGQVAEIFPHMAHDMMLDTGWQQVADRIITWLGEQAGMP